MYSISCTAAAVIELRLRCSLPLESYPSSHIFAEDKTLFLNSPPPPVKNVFFSIGKLKGGKNPPPLTPLFLQKIDDAPGGVFYSIRFDSSTFYQLAASFCCCCFFFGFLAYMKKLLNQNLYFLICLHK